MSSLERNPPMEDPVVLSSLSVVLSIVLIVSTYMLHKKTKTKKALRNLLRSKSFPTDDNEKEMFTVLVKNEALRIGGFQDSESSWHTTQALLRGIIPALDASYKYLVRKQKRDPISSLELVLCAGVSVIKSIEEKNHNVKQYSS